MVQTIAFKKDHEDGIKQRVTICYKTFKNEIYSDRLTKLKRIDNASYFPPVLKYRWETVQLIISLENKRTNKNAIM